MRIIKKLVDKNTNNIYYKVNSKVLIVLTGWLLTFSFIKMEMSLIRDKPNEKASRTKLVEGFPMRHIELHAPLPKQDSKKETTEKLQKKYLKIKVEPVQEKVKKVKKKKGDKNVKQTKKTVEQKSETRKMVVTAYTNGFESTGKHPSHSEYGTTASGVTTKQGITIACPSYMKFGTKLYIEDVGLRVCQDRGGDIKGNRLDVFIENLQKAKEFGRQTLTVQKIKNNT
ncbi:3D domain-containing protein [Bacillus pumilus]|uniref:3D domain-containing protein n=1 Tax=Bacillus pumilus TaxID=1408 RepID=UPI002281559D|nr:3D domain-containing protein [Bacillus pumilus]MCY7500184.1 3D domain-containing protein [Bacillus pumilus]MCY7528492.1 3D domain-containing protein [Bacillus pumilus]MED4439550.1 3D domain-containing protein [Bacillus pumilus]MED4489993.1 3D domain-containing protein [Bacillus pumilus]